MSVLGEAYSHIVATLFAVKAAVKLLQDATSTSLPCVWSSIVGGGVGMDFPEGYNIDFTNPTGKRGLLQMQARTRKRS